MTSAAPLRFTEAEYLALEAASDTKHEYLAGEIIAMAGARPPHNQLAANALAALVSASRGKPCAAMTSDQRVHVPGTRLYAYPDAIVACGERRYDGDNPPSLLNPSLIVEVTSDSTEEHDRGTKFLHYQAMESLREYLVVSHREQRIDHHQRLESGQWLVTTVRSGSKVPLLVLDSELMVSDVYAGVDLREGER